MEDAAADRSDGQAADGRVPGSTSGVDLHEYFRELYRRAPDPWGLATEWYEERKRALTLAALPRPRFSSALELGCAIGVLTDQLAPRCDRLVATDLNEYALAQARQRVADAADVTFLQATLPQDWPAGSFDLIVLSEVGYFLDEDSLRLVAANMLASLDPDGVVVLCHWRPAFEPAPLAGGKVHEILREALGLSTVSERTEADFLLEVLGRDPRSVAQRAGLRA